MEIPDWDEYTASLPTKVMLSPVDPTKGIVEAWSRVEQEVVRALCSDREVGDHIVVGPAGFCSREGAGAGNGIYVACSGEPEAAKRILEAYKDRLPRDGDIIVDKGFLQDVASQMPLPSVKLNAPERPSTTLYPMNANYQDSHLVFPEETGSERLSVCEFVDIGLYRLGIHRVTPEIVILGPEVVVFASTTANRPCGERHRRTRSTSS